MDQISGTTPTDAPPPPQQEPSPTDGAPATEQPGFGSRGRARRRVRFLRRARELAYRDLGGLVYNLHRFGQRNDTLVLAKLNTLAQIDGQLRALEVSLAERESVTVLREAGITACARCAAIHSSEDRFCPNCGLPIARHVDLPIAGAAAAPPATTPQPASAPQPGPGPQAAPQPAAAPTPAPSPPAQPSLAPQPLREDPAVQPGTTPADAGPTRPEAPPPLAGAHAPVPAQPPTPPGGVQTSAFSAVRPAGEEATEIVRPPTPGP